MPAVVQEGQEEPLQRMIKIVNALMARPETGPFHEPVDWRGLELWDYPSVIRTPMDLGTIRRKLERQQYSSAAQCAAEIRLVWKNCLTYNAPHSDFWLLARALSKKFEDRYRKVKQEFYVGADEDVVEEKVVDEEGEAPEGPEDAEYEDEYRDGGKEKSVEASSLLASRKSSGGRHNKAEPVVSQPPPLDAKAQLAANLLLLNGAELGHVIHTLETKCSDALELFDDTKMEIVVDAIHETLFHSLCQYAASKANQHRKTMSAAAEKAATTTTTTTTTRANSLTAVEGGILASVTSTPLPTGDPNEVTTGAPPTEDVETEAEATNKRKRKTRSL